MKKWSDRDRDAFWLARSKTAALVQAGFVVALWAAHHWLYAGWPMKAALGAMGLSLALESLNILCLARRLARGLPDAGAEAGAPEAKRPAPPNDP